MSVKQKIKSVLIANRGEIALRVIRTLKQKGIKSIAVYSDADKESPHVLMADEAYHIGAAPSSESYLLGEKIIETAKTAGADAIHPGYGFLSENAAFSASCAEADIIFMGPDASSIEVMGDKTKARLLMDKNDVPTPPGTLDAVENLSEARTAIETIGYPVLIKAAAGGGGKGMRIVREDSELESSIESAQREALSSFADGRVYIERYFEEPRHIEIQIAADRHGNVIHLWERECSIQRRHQKVIEEAPSSWVTEELRSAMGAASILAAKACDYVGVGTVEFLVDEKNSFYFMEMNTRLQVEHPVTEEITGIDLVAEQLRIAEGRTLSLTQDEVKREGHSIECRIYAEDARNGFVPNPGHLSVHRPPSGPGVRVDSGVREGQDIPIYYDPMISKLVSTGSNRQHAIEIMRRALDEYQIAGVETTLAFCRFVMDHPSFVDGSYTTKFIEHHYAPENLTTDIGPDVFALAATLIQERGQEPDSGIQKSRSEGGSLWKQRKEF